MTELIAEIGQNHNGDMTLARELIHAAADNGADTAKFQLYDARALFPRDNNPWFEYNCRTELTKDNLLLLAQECRNRGIEFLASAFDPQRVGWLEEAGVRRHKLASRSISDRALITAMITTAKPLIVSLGAWRETRFPEIESAAPVDFLYCIAKYPAELSDLKLGYVDFQRWSGFSDHTIGIHAAQVAIARGARIIEKHFTLDTSSYGPDHSGSMTPDELCALHRFRISADQCL
jgi:N,N'-diacetyllegionaminate synthase